MKEDEKPALFSRNRFVPREEDLEGFENTEEAKKAYNDKIKHNNVVFTEEAERKFEEGESSEEEDDGPKWDCESILSTYTNTDNHPGVIRT